MYKVTNKIPANWDSEIKGKPLVVLEDESGGQSVIGMDDHCYVLYNGSKDREFKSVKHWYLEAAVALKDYLIAKSPETL